MSDRIERRAAPGVAWLWLCLALPSAVTAAEGQDPGFPARLQHDGTELALQGSGSAYYARLIHVYDAALYGPPGQSPRTLLEADVPKCLTLDYRVDLDREKFIVAAERVLARQHTDLSHLRPRIEELHAAYRDVRKGDRYALCYTPGEGTRLLLNDEPLARIEGEDFARIYLGIWLGEQPLSPALREALLSTAAGPGAG